MLHFKRTLSLRNSFKLILATVILLSSRTAFAEVCVWRNPERTMVKIFPQASDYKTITKQISPEQKEIMEKRLGVVIASDESREWIYYEITGPNDRPHGYIIADAETGEYGVIEIVMGITPEGQIVDVYIQRTREKNKEFQSREFLDQFKGKSINNELELGKDITTAKELLSHQQVVIGVRKMLLFYEELAK